MATFDILAAPTSLKFAKRCNGLVFTHFISIITKSPKNTGQFCFGLIAFSPGHLVADGLYACISGVGMTKGYSVHQ